MDEKEDMGKKLGKMSLLKKILGVVVLAGVTLTTCSCNSKQKYSGNHPQEYYSQCFDYPLHMQLTVYNPLPPKYRIFQN